MFYGQCGKVSKLFVIFSHLKKIILFIYLFLAVLGLYGCSGFSLVAESKGCYLVVVHGPLLQWRLWPWSVGSRVPRLWQLRHGYPAVAAPRLQCQGSRVGVHGLSCPATCGIFLGQGIKAVSAALEVDSLPSNHHGTPSSHFLNCPRVLQVLLPMTDKVISEGKELKS